MKGPQTDSAGLKKMAELYSIHVWKMSAVVFSPGLCLSVSFSPLCYRCARTAFLLLLSVMYSYTWSLNTNSSAVFSLALQNPTALAKILGVFRIGFRNTQTNSALKQDLLVMENLFYNRKISQVQLQAHQKNIWCSCLAKKERTKKEENLFRFGFRSRISSYRCLLCGIYPTWVPHYQSDKHYTWFLWIRQCYL